MAFSNSLLRLMSFATRSHRADKMQHVREAMLSFLQQYEGARFHHVAQRVRYAEEMESLWYLRQDILLALSEVRGEGPARQQMSAINALFTGLLPQAMAPRQHNQRFIN